MFPEELARDALDAAVRYHAARQAVAPPDVVLRTAALFEDWIRNAHERGLAAGRRKN